MRKGIFALESMEDDVPAVAEGEIEKDVEQLEAADAEIESAGDDIEEMTEVQETVAAMSEKAEDSLAPAVEAPADGEEDKRTNAEKAEGDGMSEETAEVLEVAVEHFRKQLGYRKKIMPSMEGFSNVKTRRESTKLAMENLNELHGRLQGKIEIAQEGLIDTISKTLVGFFVTDKKVLARLEVAVSKYETNGATEGPVKASLALRRTFTANGRTEVTGKDAVADMKAYAKLASLIGVSMNRLAAISREINTNLKEGGFNASEEIVAKIEGLHQETEQIVKTIAEVKKEAKVSGQGEATYAALSAPEVSQIKSLVEKMLKFDETEFGQTFGGNFGKNQDTYAHNNYAGSLSTLWEAKLVGVFAKDKRKATAARGNIYRACLAVEGAFHAITAAAASAVAYVEASIK